MREPRKPTRFPRNGTRSGNTISVSNRQKRFYTYTFLANGCFSRNDWILGSRRLLLRGGSLLEASKRTIENEHKKKAIVLPQTGYEND